MATVEELAVELAAYQAARNAILSGAQSYQVSGQSVTRASLDTIEKQIARIEARISRINRSGRAVKAPLFGA